MKPIRSSAYCNDAKHAHACVQAIHQAGYSAVPYCYRWTDGKTETWSVSSSNMPQDALETLIDATVTK